MATEAAWLKGKMKKSLRESENILDTDRPSHGRDLNRIVLNLFRFYHLLDRGKSIVQKGIVLLCVLSMLGCSRPPTVVEAKRELTVRFRD